MRSILRSRALKGMMCAATVAVFGVIAAAQSGALRYQWKPGETLRYRSTVQSDVVMSGLPGGDMTVTNSIGQVQAMTAEKVEADGTATVRVVTESVRMDIGSPMGTMSYDSTSKTPPSDPVMSAVAAVMGATIGQPITFVMAPDGGVKSVTGAAAILERIKQRASGLDLSAIGNVEEQMSDETLRAGFDQGFGKLPAKPVKAGDSWSTSAKVPNPMGDMTIAMTFTMQGTETVNGRVLTKITHTAKITGGAGEMGPMSTQLGAGTGEGELWFDQQRGRVQRAVVRQSLPMTLSMPGPDGSPMTVGGQLTNTITLDLIEK